MKKLTLSKKSVLITSGGIAGVIVVWLIIANVISPTTPSSQEDAKGVSPPFHAALPNSTPIRDLGGWETKTAPSGDTFYAFSDTINGVAIRVSQQALPASFKTNTSQKIAELAKGYNATTPLTTDTTSVTAYIGSSARGPQSVIFAKDDSLVLIQSEGVISNAAWATYIASLR